jgi:hypothetical protein
MPTGKPQRINYNERIRPDRLARLSQKRTDAPTFEEKLYTARQTKPQRETFDAAAAAQRAAEQREELREFGAESKALSANTRLPKNPVPLSQMNPHDYLPKKTRNEGNNRGRPARTADEIDEYTTKLFGMPVRIERGDKKTDREIAKIVDSLTAAGVRSDRIEAAANHLTQLVQDGNLEHLGMHEAIVMELTASEGRISDVLKQLDAEGADTGTIMMVHQSLSDMAALGQMRDRDIQRVLEELSSSGAVKTRQEVTLQAGLGGRKISIPVGSELYDELLDAEIGGVRLLRHSGVNITWSSDDRKVQTDEAKALIRSIVRSFVNSFDDGAGGDDSDDDV